jgi:pimeloyl-ACP methyl ester carboxylesterase
MDGLAEGMLVTTRTGRIAYRIEGEGDGPPLLLLPRFRGTMDDWDPELIAKLSAGRRVIRFDSAGVGESDGDAPDSIAGMSAIAIAFVEALGLEDFDILGWSMGGFIAQNLALDLSDRVRRLIIAGSSPGGLSGGPSPDPRVSEVAGKPANDREDLLFLFFACTPSSRAAGLSSLARIEKSTTTSAVRGQTVMAQAKAIGKWSAGEGAARPRLDSLKIPTLVAGGARDILMPAYGSFVLAQEIPSAKLILYPDSGHGFLFQYIEDFSREVSAFLD